MNWKIRLKNPVFWVQVLTGALATVLAYSGLTAADMTTWAGLGGVLLEAIKNPVILVAVVVSAWNLINDPTTRGLGDSERALGYTEPHK